MGQGGLFLWQVGFATKLILVLPYPVKAILKGQEQNDKIFEHKDYKLKYWWWDHQPFIGDNYHDYKWEGFDFLSEVLRKFLEDLELQHSQEIRTFMSINSLWWGNLCILNVSFWWTIDFLSVSYLVHKNLVLEIGQLSSM